MTGMEFSAMDLAFLRATADIIVSTEVWSKVFGHAKLLVASSSRYVTDMAVQITLSFLALLIRAEMNFANILSIEML